MKHVGAIFIVAMGLVACAPEHSVTPKLILQLPARKPSGQFVTFRTVLDSVINIKCLKCHNGMTEHSDLTDYSGVLADDRLVRPGLPEESQIYTLVQSSQMPRKGPKLTDDEIQLIFDWIFGGAKP